MTMRAAAKLLLIESAAIGPLLRAASEADFDRPTVCDGWSVRDVVAHCAAALTRASSGELHAFTPEDNQADVDERRGLTTDQVLTELISSYSAAATAIDDAEGQLDGIGLGEWMHGGDIREALGAPHAYVGDGIELVLDLLIERSERIGKRAATVDLGDRTLRFGAGDPVGTVTADVETFVRLCGGRNPNPARYRTEGEVSAADMVLFS